MRHYVGGLKGWTEHGGALAHEHGRRLAVPAAVTARVTAQQGPRRAAESGQWAVAALDWFGARSLAQLLVIWVVMVLAFGLLYWLGDIAPGVAGLVAASAPVPRSWPGLLTAREFNEMLPHLPAQAARPAGLVSSFHAIAALAREICGECVPREYAPHLKAWMDKVQELASALIS